MKKRTAPRIIAGKLKGIRLKSLPGNITRPITDRVKENLFNIIGSDIKDSSFLDAFGGTGSVGIEAFSRGARFVQFIEKNQKPFLLLQENLKLIKDASYYSIMKHDAIKFLVGFQEKSFDFIFIAPPQYKNLWKLSLDALDRNPSLLAIDGTVVVQIDPVEYADIQLSNFREVDKRKYGSTLLIFYEKVAT